MSKTNPSDAKPPPPDQPVPGTRRTPSGTMKITYIAADFDAPDQEIMDMFEGKYSTDPTDPCQRP